MYKNIKKTAMLFIAAASMFAFGCTKENNGTSSDGKFEMKKADITYKIVLEPACASSLEKAYDLSVEYYDAEGKVKTVSPLSPSILNWELPVTQTSFPSYYGIKVVITPKSDLSGVGEDQVFDLLGKVQAVAKATSTNGKTRNLLDISEQMLRRGLDPREGLVTKIGRRVEVQKDGSSKSTSWE